MGFHQIVLPKELRPITSFKSNKGLYIQREKSLASFLRLWFSSIDQCH